MSNCHDMVEADLQDQVMIRRGPWTLEEDTLLLNYIARHGEGRWNLLARSAGLKRNGKSCRLRWLNYLKPDIKRGNLTRQEQLLILELHSKWGNRWSKIAQHLPGRTDNEVKNYWRTRVQKQAKQLNLESNSKSFLDAVRSIWTPPPGLLHNMIMDPHPQTPTSHSNSNSHNFQICSQLPAAPSNSEILGNSIIPQNPISTHEQLDNNLLISLVSDQSYGNHLCPTTSDDQPTLFFSDQPHHQDHLFNNYDQPHDHILANSTCYYDHADMADRTPPLSTMSATIDPYWTNYQQMIMPNADDRWTPPPPPPHADHAANTLWKMDDMWQFEN